MKQFWIFVKKEFRHILRDLWSTIIVLVLPILMIVLFGFGISSEMKSTAFGVLNIQENSRGLQIVENMDQSDFFELKSSYPTEQSLENAFKAGEIRFAIVFGKEQIRLIADATDPNSASTMVAYASGIIGQFFQNQNPSITPKIKSEIKLLYNPSLKGTYNTVPGIIGMVLLLISAMMSSVSIAKEKEMGSMELLLISKLKPMTLILSKLLPYFVLSNVNLLSTLILGHYLLEVPINGSLISILLFSELYLLLSLSIGLLISSVTDSQLVALLLSGMGMILPVVMLSGLLFPIDNMPLILQWLSNIVPAKWYIDGLRKLMIMGLGWSDVIKELMILCLLFTVCLTLSLKRFKTRLE